MEYGLIGEKLGHSHSPKIHSLLGSYSYELKEIAPHQVGEFLRKKEFRGLNVTIPYKKTVMDYCDSLGEGAKRVGCVNTIVKQSDGTLFGENTDYYGFMATLQRSHINPKGLHCLVLGSGGTSLTATAVLEDMGAAAVRRVSRSGDINYENIYERTETELIVNTTPLGMYPNNGISPVVLSRFPNLKAVADVVYNPLKTAFLLEAESLSIPYATGLPMLVGQAVKAAELFLGTIIPQEKAELALRTVSRSVTNLVLIGMPGSGKTTIGRLLAQTLQRDFVDADEEIVAQSGKTIPEIFEKEGEAGFRERETEVLKTLSKRSGIVLSTGGGAVTYERNLPALRQNGVLVRIKRPVELLSTDGRPLSTSLEQLKTMETAREPYYAAAADFTVDNTATPEEAAAIILEWFKHGGLV